VATVWVQGAERFGDGVIGGVMDGGKPRSTQHTVECPPGRGYFMSMGAYLVRVATEPQLLYDPQSDSLGQFGPLNRSGRALRNAGSVRTNRTGTVNIQVEVCAYASRPWTTGFNPAEKPNYLKMIAAIDSWDVPRDWPAGPPQAYPGDHDDRDMWTWLNRSGYFGHSQVPGNDHGDPGAIDITKCPPRDGVGPTPPPADANAFPGAAYFGPGKTNTYITRLGEMLIARGARRFYAVGPSPFWGESDRLATQAFQRAQGWTGADADGFPGPTTWSLLTRGAGSDVPSGAAPTTPTPVITITLRGILNAARSDPPKSDTSTTNYAEVIVVEDALAADGFLDRSLVDGHFGTATVAAYAEFQRSLGYTGAAANGIPGLSSLTTLGRRHNFRVVER
jgi:peptidoglycan hydrolase-like protein with peptidoglycan-binding domain